MEKTFGTGSRRMFEQMKRNDRLYLRNEDGQITASEIMPIVKEGGSYEPNVSKNMVDVEASI